MNGPAGGFKAHQKRNRTPERSDDNCGGNSADLGQVGIKNSPVFLLLPSDPIRQAKRLPLRVLKMLTAHASHMLHPEYLQPLTSAPISIELDAKKSPLALLAQTCSQIGKPDPPPTTKLGPLSASGLGDKEALGRPSGSALKLGEPRPPPEDKSSFKPYSKVGGECRKEGGGVTDKAGFRLAGGGGGGGGGLCGSFPPHAVSPNSTKTTHSPPLHPHSPPLAPPPPLHTDPKPAPPRSDTPPSDCGGGGASRKEAEPCKPSPDANSANSANARASANSSSGSSASSPHPESQPPQPGHVAPVSPYKPAHPLFPLSSPSPSGMGYHGSIVGAYAGYPSPFVPGLDHTKSGLVAGGVKHPSSSPPSFIQGLCRDPYCLTYPNAAHLGGSNCSSCVHDPSSSPLKSGFPLVYPSHHLHSLHPGSLSSGATPGLSHPLYSFLLPPGEPLPHGCNWVSAGGPCDKRFASSEELLAHLRTHTALSAADGAKLLSAYASPVTSCHLHLPSQASPAPLASSFSLRAPPSLGLARYHPYSKVHLPAGHSLPLPSLPPASSPYYSPYALYSQRLGSAAALGYP